MAKLVSKTYGDALFELAMETGRIDELFEEVTLVEGILAEEKDLSKLMLHPKIVKEEKIQLLETIFKDKISNELLGLLTMLLAKNHYAEIPAVFSYFINQVKEYKNIGTVFVTAAQPLSDAQKEKIQARLLETTKYETLEISYQVDPELMGGLIIRIGDRVVDSSVRTKLKDLTRELSQLQLKVGESTP